MHLSIDTVLPADSVEFCPHPDASDIFVCGTYKLQDERSSDSITLSSGQIQKRTGQCLVFEVDSEQEISVCEPPLLLCVILYIPLNSDYLQLQDSGDFPPCGFGSKMVSENETWLG